MDLYSLYGWITSLLRPRDRYKCTEDQSKQLEQKQPQFHPSNPANPVHSSTSQASEEREVSHAEVQLIRTLEFVIQKPQQQHVAPTIWETSKNIDNNNETDENEARSTFVIPTTVSAEHSNNINNNNNYSISDDKQREINLCLSRNISDRSFVDEPTSSISIEMDSSHKTGTNATLKSSPENQTKVLTSTTSAGMVKKAITATSTTTTESSDQSIAEEIEEVLEELSEESKADEEIKVYASGRISTVISGGSGQNTQSSEVVRNPKDALPSDPPSPSSGRAANSVDAKFEIDDDQLSGGQLAQHFVLGEDEDEEDGNDADDDFNISLPIDKNSDTKSNNGLSINASGQQNLAHSRHEDTSSDHLRSPADVQPESLTNQSTANDVSDFIEDVKPDDETEASLNDSLSLPLSETALDKPTIRVEKFPKATSTSKLIFSSTLSEEVDRKLSSSSAKESKDKSDQGRESFPKETATVSLEYSEKDHSVEEIVESNQSVEMTFNDKDLSSLHVSFNRQDDTIVNQLLADTPTQTQHKRQPEETSDDTDKKKSREEEKTGKKKSHDQMTEHKTIKVLEQLDLKSPEKEPIQSVPSFPERKELLIEPHVQKLKSLEASQVPERVRKQADSPVEYTTKAFEDKSVCVPEMEPLEITTHSLELGAFDLASLTSSTLFEALEKQHQAAKRAKNTSPDADKTLTNSKGAPLSGDQKDNVDDDDDDDDESHDLEIMKLRILAIKHEQYQQTTNEAPATTDLAATASSSVRQMERVSLTDFSKDVLEDITEESERNSLSTADEQQTLSMERTRKSEMSEQTMQQASEVQQQLEQKVSDLQLLLVSKDACLASLNQQLEAAQRNRDSNGGASSGEQLLSSGRDSSSLITNSTEYRTLQEDLGGGPIADFYMELTKRDELIAKLTESLQLSLNVREGLQTESEKLGAEVQQLRKQLTEAMDAIRRPNWARDQESNGGQRISQISMDLISESDDDELERQFLTENEDKISRSSRERQLSVPRQPEDFLREHEAADYSPALALSKQLEQFQKYLTPSEVRLFFMVQKKFDDFMCQELEKCKTKHDHELKSLVEKLENEKQEQTDEIKQLLRQRLEQDDLHSKAMEDLRKYFEHKCADLEKQYSDEVFSQKSQHLYADSSSEGSEQEQMPEEIASFAGPTRCKELLSRKRTRAELLLSPSHRQMTPSVDAKEDSPNLARELTEMKSFYQQKMYEMQRGYEENLRRLSERLKYYENRYPEDDFVSTEKINANTEATETGHESITTHVRDLNTSLIIIDQDELGVHNDSQVIQKIIEEYEKRLQEQLALAKNDIVLELENQIQALLSDVSTADDHHWPPELILLREKFTAKSQLEIAQLQIKHEEEMSRLKIEYEKQLNRKSKRHSTFDLARDFDQIIGERDGLRELSKTFRHVLAELAKCVLNCEDDLNATLVDEMQKLLANRSFGESEMLDDQLHFHNSSLNSTLLTHSKRYVPDVQSLLAVIEDPNLKDFVSNKTGGDLEDFDLNECLERLKSEAAVLLQLSEEIVQKRKRRNSECSDGEKNDNCCEAEEGLKITLQHPVHKFTRANSLNEQQLSSNWQLTKSRELLSSLPPDLNRLQQQSVDDDAHSSIPGNATELNFQVHELKNRLVKSEADRLKLQQELEHTIRRNAELSTELQALRDQFAQMDSLNRTDYAEGYGLGSSMKSPTREGAEKSSTSFAQLQEKARNILSTPTQQRNHDATATLLQMIEDFCREGDKVVEWNKKDREDLQSQIVAADKQLKAIRQFLEEQAVEREQERDEFLREIERLKALLRDKEKERSSYENASKENGQSSKLITWIEVEQQESQIHELGQKLTESNTKRDKFEVELKASIDKIFVLREIISELETQVETKALNEHVLGEKVKQLEDYVSSQSRSNDNLHLEVQSLRTEIDESYKERIRQLEEKLQNVRPSAEQSMVLDQLIEQLHDIENSLDQKNKTLEALHNSSNSSSLTITEDVSVHGVVKSVAPSGAGAGDALPSLGSPLHPSPRQHSLSMEGVQRIVDKLAKHTRVEEATIKRIKDLEMHLNNIRGAFVELQHERDSLQERMSEQMQRISALQSRLEEQRQRAEELQRAGTADLNIRIHDLQNEVHTLRETLGSRDKQITNLRQQLEKSKVAIDHLEAELAAEQHPDRNIVERLERELQQRNGDVQLLRNKIKSEMVNRLTLPDLMDTMLTDKNEEIDHLKHQLDAKQRELDGLERSSPNSSAGFRSAGRASDRKEETGTKLSARTLSDILSISEFDEPDVIRRAAAARQETPVVLPHGGSYMQQTMETSKEVVANLTHRRTEELDVFSKLRPTNTFDNPHYFQDANAELVSAKSNSSSNNFTPPLVPRQINFSALTEDSKGKPSSFLFQTPEERAQYLGTGSRQDEELRPSSPRIAELQHQLEAARTDLKKLVDENNSALATKQQELNMLEEDLLSTQMRLSGLQEDLQSKETELADLLAENLKLNEAQQELTAKCVETDQLLKRVSTLTEERNAQSEALTKQEKELANYRQNEEQYLRRLAEQEEKIGKNASELVNLRQELKDLRTAHAQCTETLEAHAGCKERLNALNLEIKSKDERLLTLTTKLTIAEDASQQLQQQAASMQQEIEKLRSQQQSDNSSRQFSVDEIAQQLEKELNYSAQLDSSILKAIESEEENNLDRTLVSNKQATEIKEASVSDQQNGTDDENFIGERELLNQLEAMRAQIVVEREQVAELRQDLQAEKQHSQEIQEQDVVIIEAMRVRLEKALAQEDELHKLLDQEREKCERLNTQLTVLQRSDSRRNSALLKSPTDSPRRSPRSSDFDMELAERLRSEIKLLNSQQERERERNADLQHNLERERSRFATELQDRITYSERLKQEMERLARDKELSEQEAEHLQERLMLQSQEIESLEARIATLQEAETRRIKRRDQQLQENAQNMAELHELKQKLETLESERDHLTQSVALLRFDLERSASRETKLAEALANGCGGGGAGSGESSIPQQFLQKMKDINLLLAENTKENRQMAETVQFLVDERRQLQRRCEELEQQQGSNAKVSELEERCNHLLGRYLRVESHRKALVYQKRYLKISLQSYQESEARALEAMNAGLLVPPQKQKRRLFKTVALAIVAIQRMKFIGRIWHTGKRIVSKSVFTITQQKRSQAPTISCAAVSSTVPSGRDGPPSTPTSPRYNLLDQRLAPLQAPALLSELSSKVNNPDQQQNGHACQCATTNNNNNSNKNNNNNNSGNTNCKKFERQFHRHLSHT